MKTCNGTYFILHEGYGLERLESIDFDAGVFIICEKGELKLLLDAKLIVLSENEVLSLTPSSIFQVKSISHDFIGHTVIYPSYLADEGPVKENLLSFLIKIKEAPVLSVSDRRMKIAKEYVSLLASLFNQGEIQPHPLVDGIINSLIYTIYMGYVYKEKSNKIVPDRQIDRNRTILMEFLRLVRKYYVEEREVRFYADKMCITPKHLCTAVKHACNLTPSQIINQAIILAAKSKLRNSSSSVSQIAYELNFDNPSFFGTFFKRHVGYSPGQFQRHYGLSLRHDATPDV